MDKKALVGKAIEKYKNIFFKLYKSRTWDPSAYYGSLNHVFQRRKADIIARELRDEWDKI